MEQKEQNENLLKCFYWIRWKKGEVINCTHLGAAGARVGRCITLVDDAGKEYKRRVHYVNALTWEEAQEKIKRGEAK